MSLVDSELALVDPVHFFAVSARILRQILEDHARTNKREKCGGGATKVPLDDAIVVGLQSSGSVLDLDEAL